MVLVTTTVRLGGLHPLEACKAWHLKRVEGRSWPDVVGLVRNVEGEEPGLHAARNAVARVAGDRKKAPTDWPSDRWSD